MTHAWLFEAAICLGSSLLSVLPKTLVVPKGWNPPNIVSCWLPPVETSPKGVPSKRNHTHVDLQAASWFDVQSVTRRTQCCSSLLDWRCLQGSLHFAWFEASSMLLHRICETLPCAICLVASPEAPLFYSRRAFF